MDLGSVKTRLQALSYTHMAEFAADVRLVFSNAKRYVPPTHPPTLYEWIEEEEAVEMSYCVYGLGGWVGGEIKMPTFLLLYLPAHPSTQSQHPAPHSNPRLVLLYLPVYSSLLIQPPTHPPT